MILNQLRSVYRDYSLFGSTLPPVSHNLSTHSRVIPLENEAEAESEEADPSFVELGDAFEEITQRLFQNFGSFTLHRCGGKSDGGVDLVGTFEDQIRIVVQCKRSKYRASPRWLREFEGAIESHRHNPEIFSPSHLPPQLLSLIHI